ncbi:MAG: STAS domain-containing protein [Pyrinomonadaceae bacterium]
MPTQITQIRDDDRDVTILRVDGEMFSDDAVLLQKIAIEMRGETGDNIILDLADLDFLDSEAASVLRRLASLDGFSIEGMEIFLQTVVNNVERHHG